MGLGGEGAVPGQGQGLIENLKMMLGTEVVDHSSEDGKPGVRCQPVPQVTAACMTSQMPIGEKRGVWGPMNNCWTAVNSAIHVCSRETALPGRDATNVNVNKEQGSSDDVAALLDAE